MRMCPLCRRDMSDSWLALGTQILKRRSITIRHDHAMHRLANFLRSAGVLASHKDGHLHSLVSNAMTHGEFFLSWRASWSTQPFPQCHSCHS